MPKRTPTKAVRATRPQPVYFLSLTLSNVRCFGLKQSLDLSDGKGRPARWTVILGDNGTGKTTLLRALADMVPSTMPEISPSKVTTSPSAFFLRTDETPLVRSGLKEASFQAVYGYGALCGVKDGNYQTASLSYTLDYPQGTSPYGQADHTAAPSQNMLVLGYGANRPLGTGSLADYHSSGVENLMVESSTLINAEEWLLQQDYIASQGNGTAGPARKRRDRIIALLKDLLPKDDIEDITFKPVDLSPTRQRMAVHVKTPYGEVQLRALSLGYRTLLAWVIDLVAQLAARYPNSKNPLHEPAVVLVDEIDLHLHPKWQRQLFASLSEKFPNIQFIVTAHSPLIVQAAGADANIVVLHRPEGENYAVIDPAPAAIHSWRVDQILTSDLYGLPSARPPELDEKYARRRELLRKPKLTKKEKAELEALEAWLVTQPGGENPEEMSFWNTLRDVTARLQAKRGRSS